MLSLRLWKFSLIALIIALILVVSLVTVEASFSNRSNSNLLALYASKSRLGVAEPHGEVIVASRGSELTLVTQVIDGQGAPASGKLVCFYDEKLNQPITVLVSNDSGYANFRWLVPDDYDLGERVINATPVKDDLTPDPDYTANPAFFDVRIVSETRLEVVSHPENVTPSAMYNATFHLEDNLGNGMAGVTLSLYDDSGTLLSSGPTDESGTATLSFIIPGSTQLGYHNLTAKYSGNETHTPSEVNFTVHVYKPPQPSDPVITGVQFNTSVVKPQDAIKVTVQTQGTVNYVLVNSINMTKTGECSWEAVFTAPQTQGNHTVTLRAVGNGKEYILERYLYVDATPPRVNASLNATSVNPGGPVKVTVMVVDETEVTGVYANNVLLTENDGVWVGIIKAPPFEGEYEVEVTAWDEAGNKASTTLNYRVTSTEPVMPGNPGAEPDEHGTHILPLILTLSILSYSLPSSSGDGSGYLLLSATVASCSIFLLFTAKRYSRIDVIEDPTLSLGDLPDGHDGEGP
ncbi:MAG: hypothetical protein ACTSWP_08030 [Candidatus Freyarchaeota archaeon]